MNLGNLFSHIFLLLPSTVMKCEIHKTLRMNFCSIRYAFENRDYDYDTVWSGDVVGKGKCKSASNFGPSLKFTSSRVAPDWVCPARCRQLASLHCRSTSFWFCVIHHLLDATVEVFRTFGPVHPVRADIGPFGHLRYSVGSCLAAAFVFVPNRDKERL